VEARGRPIPWAIGTCITVCLAIAGLTAFFHAEDAMDLPWLILATIACGSAAVLAGVVAARRVRSRLVLDNASRMVRWMIGRFWIEIPFEDVAAWGLCWAVPKRLSPGRRLQYASPLLSLWTKDGREIPIHVFKASVPAYLRGPIARKVADELAATTDSDIQIVENLDELVSGA
jgi:hypothetical protein